MPDMINPQKGIDLMNNKYNTLCSYNISTSVTRTEPEPVKPIGPTGSEPRPVLYGTGFFLPMRPAAGKMREFFIFLKS
jgi:hypothetical protein